MAISAVSNGLFCLIAERVELEDFALHPFVVAPSPVEMECGAGVVVCEES